MQPPCVLRAMMSSKQECEISPVSSRYLNVTGWCLVFDASSKVAKGQRALAKYVLPDKRVTLLS